MCCFLPTAMIRAGSRRSSQPLPVAPSLGLSAPRPSQRRFPGLFLAPLPPRLPVAFLPSLQSLPSFGECLLTEPPSRPTTASGQHTQVLRNRVLLFRVCGVQDRGTPWPTWGVSTELASLGSVQASPQPLPSLCLAVSPLLLSASSPSAPKGPF